MDQNLKNPIVSVIMPAFNAEKYIGKAIESILNQTLTEFEFIIVNDGSTDRTEEIILSYQDHRIVYVKNEKNLKLVLSLNKAVRMARGKYIARMDADDISTKERLSIQLKAIEKTGADVLGSAARYFGDFKKSHVKMMPGSLAEIKYCMLSFCPLIHPTIIAKAKVLKENPYSERYDNYAEDFALWAELIVKGYRILNITDICLHYRISHSQFTSLRFEKHSNLTHQIRNEYALNIYGRTGNDYESFLNNLSKSITVGELNFWINWLIEIGINSGVGGVWVKQAVKNLLRNSTRDYLFFINALRNYRDYLTLIDVYYILRKRVG